MVARVQARTNDPPIIPFQRFGEECFNIGGVRYRIRTYDNVQWSSMSPNMRPRNAHQVGRVWVTIEPAL